MLVEPYDRLAIDQSYRRALEPPVEQLLQCSLIGTHILLHEVNAPLR